jgi:uridylate kinase
VALSIGGSVLTLGDDDAGYFDRLASLLRRLGRSFPLVVTTGGGRTAREYIRLGRALGLTEVELDEIGIDVTRLHARILAARIGPPTPAHPPETIAEAVREVHRASPVVLGGTEPGHTTDGVAALLAVRLRALRLVNATRVGGLYDRDPTRDPGARRLDRVGFDEFRRIVAASASGEAGQEFVFDRLGADALSRAGIPIAIVHGRDLANLESALLGRPFEGTWVGGNPSQGL